MVQRVEQENDFVAEFQMMSDAIGANLRVACVGIVQSFDVEKLTVTVQPSGQEAYRIPNGDTETVDLPLLVDVPVWFPRSRDFIITFPIKPGDECVVLFMDRCIDGWHQSGDVQPQTESRMHDLSDGIAFVGPMSQKQLVKNVHPDNVQIRHVDESEPCYIEITPEKDINIETPGRGVWHLKGQLQINSDTEILLNAPHIGLNG